MPFVRHRLLQEHDDAAKADEDSGKHASGGAADRAPQQGEDMSDKDVAKLIVVKQSRQRRGDVRPGAEHHAEEAHIISEGLHFFEHELQEASPPSY